MRILLTFLSHFLPAVLNSRKSILHFMYQMSQQSMYAGSGCRSNYSPLETIAHSAVHYSAVDTLSYSTSIHQIPLKTYATTDVLSQPYTPTSSYTLLQSQIRPEYHFIPETFLRPGREGKFVGQAEEIKEYVQEAFTAMFDAPFPNDIKISVCSREEFRKLAPHPSTIGLSLNRQEAGLLSEIFVLNDSLGRVMLTIGHELGHVLTKTLDNPQDEEAKAYAFSLAWMNVIREYDIAGLADAIVAERPAENGLHNVAFFFVERLIRQGKGVWEVYTGLVRRLITTNYSF